MNSKIFFMANLSFLRWSNLKYLGCFLKYSLCLRKLIEVRLRIHDRECLRVKVLGKEGNDYNLWEWERSNMNNPYKFQQSKRIWGGKIELRNNKNNFPNCFVFTDVSVFSAAVCSTPNTYKEIIFERISVPLSLTLEMSSGMDVWSLEDQGP